MRAARLKLQWEEYPTRRLAYVGESHVSVRRCGRKGAYQWIVDEVFGAKWQDDENYDTVEQAMAAAEHQAEETLATIAACFKRRRGGWALT